MAQMDPAECADYEKVKCLCPAALLTRNRSYRKDDRAMHPTYGCPENFRESLPRLLFPKFLMGYCSTEPINVRAKFELRSFTRP